MEKIVYARELSLSVDDYIRVVGDSTLGPGRPLSDRPRLEAMLTGANFFVTARLDGECIGLARGLTDFAWVCYLGDVAVRNGYQGKGVGRSIMLKCKEELGDGVAIALLSMPEAKPFYDSLESVMNLKRNANAYYMQRERGV